MEGIQIWGLCEPMSTCVKEIILKEQEENEKETSESNRGRQDNPCSDFTVTACLPPAKGCYCRVAFLRVVLPLPSSTTRERDHKCFPFVKVLELKGLNCKFILAILTFLSILTYKYKTIKQIGEEILQRQISTHRSVLRYYCG